ncbi:MAG: GNAT family N-acetyltransferase [Pirellulales bacterium]|nr:GNAT family N-acetyltransferase [Pirellulales bacterium]
MSISALVRGGAVFGTTMGDFEQILQIRPGRIAALSAYALAKIVPDSAAMAAVRAALELSRQRHVRVVQSLVGVADSQTAERLKSVGFSHITDVFHLVCAVSDQKSFPIRNSLRFMLFDDTPQAEVILSQLISQTYDASQDCPELNGKRPVDEVLASYRAIGHNRRQTWFVAQQESANVGCLLLAEHPKQRDLELIYMGVVPPFRGRGMGRDFIEHARTIAGGLPTERLSLAVDARNKPALAIYRAAGFAEAAKYKLYLLLL